MKTFREEIKQRAIARFGFGTWLAMGHLAQMTKIAKKIRHEMEKK